MALCGALMKRMAVALGVALFLIGCGADDTATPGNEDAGTLACSVSQAYEYGYVGGLRLWVGRSYLLGGGQYRYDRVVVRQPGSTTSCSPDLPACDGAAAETITAAQLGAAIAHKDVQNALAARESLTYGRDTRPVDGSIFQFRRTADERDVLMGGPCSDPPVLPPGERPACVDVPPGLAALRALLIKLDQQQLASAQCASVKG